MTLLSACQEASIQLISQAPTTFFSSTGNFETELRTLANVAARAISGDHDWQALTKLHTITTGDGVTEGHSMPPDYDRMPVKMDVHSPDWTTWRYTPARDLDQFLDFKNGLSIARPGSWIIYGDEMHFWPVLQSGENAQFYYVSKNIVRSESGTLKQTFTKDDDTFVLDETLLSLALIWRWRQMKRLEYAEDMANFEREFAQKSGRDRGSKILATGPSRMPANVGIAYPRALG
jgi:hypothetical protein